MSEQPSSYRQILRATSIIGVASGVNIVFQIIRVKVLAVLLGPGGMGLFGMFQSMLTTATSLAGMGISSSAVRQIAEARSNGDEQRISEVVYVLRVLTIGLGALGAAAVFMLREPIAQWTFGDTSHAVLVGWLGIGVFVGVASQSLSALLQGYRRIGDQARLQVWSGVLSTVLAIGAIAWLGRDGIIIFVVAMPFIAMLLAWHYARQIGLTVKRVALQPFKAEARRLVSLGLMIMVAGALQGWALLALRSHITQTLGIDATGLFQAAWALSFVYMGFVLDAMGKDYYPHLTEHVADKEKTVQLMQEQINVALILIGPLVIGMIAFAPLIIDLLYTRSFRDAIPVIQWMGIGNLLKVVTWPLGFILLIHTRKGLFIALEVIWVSVFLGVSWLLSGVFGLTAVGIGFVSAYLLNLMAIFVSCRKLTGFGFNQKNIRIILFYGALAFISFFTASYEIVMGYAVGTVALSVATWGSYKKIVEMIGEDPLRALFNRFYNR